MKLFCYAVSLGILLAGFFIVLAPEFRSEKPVVQVEAEIPVVDSTEVETFERLVGIQLSYDAFDGGYFYLDEEDGYWKFTVSTAEHTTVWMFWYGDDGEGDLGILYGTNQFGTWVERKHYVKPVDRNPKLIEQFKKRLKEEL